MAPVTSRRCWERILRNVSNLVLKYLVKSFIEPSDVDCPVTSFKICTLPSYSLAIGFLDDNIVLICIGFSGSGGFWAGSGG